MITPMNKYSFILLSGDAEKFLSDLQGLGVVDVTRSAKPVDDKSAKMLEEADSMRRLISSLEKDDPVSDRRTEIENAIKDAQREQSARRVWGSYDMGKLRKLEEIGLKVRYYCVSSKSFDPEWPSQVPLQVVGEDSGSTYFVTVSDDPAYSFPVKETLPPSGTLADSEKEIASLEKDLETEKARLAGMKKELPSYRKQYSDTLTDLDRYLARQGGESAAENHLVVFEGFAPVENEAALDEAFSKMDAFYLKDASTVEDNPPIKFHNNWFVRMFEPLTDMYGRPDYDEFDPTPYISIFFMLFFAFCMGDMGYGILLVILGLLLKKTSGSLAKFSPLVVTLGVATIIVGFLFHTFFSLDISTWECIPDFLKKIMLPSQIAGYDGTMVLALVVGVIHLSLAMIVKTIQATKNKGFKNSLGTWGWTLLVVGGVIVGAFALVGVLDKSLTKWIIIVLGIVSAIGIFFLNDLHRNPLVNVGVGLWDTYQMVTGLLGDVLSYLRLYALGLAGGMLGLAFNDLGWGIVESGGGSIPSWIFFILIVVIGHVLNFAMAILGAFVHPLRLNFLEFFKNSDYQGKGRRYSPLGGENA